MKKKLKAPPDMPFSKQKQLASKYRERDTVIPGKEPKKIKLKIKEDELQKQCNDTLEAYRIRYVRVDDRVWFWIKRYGPAWLLKMLARLFGGMPDNVAFLPISPKYNLALMLELKTETGKLRGKQNTWKKELSVQISKYPDETIAIIQEFIKEAEEIRGVLEEYYKKKDQDKCQEK